MIHADKNTVCESYDKIADWFDELRTRDLIERPYLEALIEMLKQSSLILDLGCGTGEPILRFLSQSNYRITGVDGSRIMLGKAIKRFPEMEFYSRSYAQYSL
nr:methyltransferase domain-containing protein [uncultured Desulfobacter sp.]